MLPTLSPFVDGVSLGAQDHDCLVEGPLDNMQTSLMTFPPPLKGRMDHRRLYFTALAQGTHAGANSQVEDQDHSNCVIALEKRTVMQHYVHTQTHTHTVPGIDALFFHCPYRSSTLVQA